MRILLTSDAVGGVGSFAGALAAALAAKGDRVMVVCCGPGGKPGGGGGGVEHRAISGPLEWMSECAPASLEAACAAGRRHMAEIAAAFRPDVLHTNQFAWAGGLPGLPCVLTAHSDVVSWWRAVGGTAPPRTPFREWYGGVVRRALAAADAVVAPSRSAAEDLRRSFPGPPVGVIYNGLEPADFPAGEKLPHAISAGRLWDRGKQTDLLGPHPLALPVTVAGAGARAPSEGVRYAGALPRLELARLMARASVYIGTSRYEPFGLAPLEAALAGCALLLNDIPSFREIWGDAALYFAAHDGAALAAGLRRLASDGALVAEHARRAHGRACERYTAARMAAAYRHLYANLLR